MDEGQGKVLHELIENGKRNGVGGMSILSRKEVRTKIGPSHHSSTPLLCVTDRPGEKTLYLVYAPLEDGKTDPSGLYELL
jgi:hypothetical protein